MKGERSELPSYPYTEAEINPVREVRASPGLLLQESEIERLTNARERQSERRGNNTFL